MSEFPHTRGEDSGEFGIVLNFEYNLRSFLKLEGNLALILFRDSPSSMVFFMITRRNILKTSVAFTCGSSMLGANQDHGETEFFKYQLAPKFPYIESQRNHQAFAYSPGKIMFSEDNGVTWPHVATFSDALKITFSCILGNGNILFATFNQLFLSTDKLQSFREITVKNADGTDYLPHKPTNPSQPGWYFHALDGVHTWNVEGREMLVWGNYCNVIGGAVPVNIFYSTDYGETVKIAYSFGQNPRYKDGPNLLGNPHNKTICRHIHCVAYNPLENAFYCCTGDRDHADGKHECHWLRGKYNVVSDCWQWEVLVSTDNNSRYKTGGVNFVDGWLYWAADANGKLTPENPKYDRGIFRCKPADLTNPELHTQLFDPKYESANMLIEDNFIIAAHYAPASPYYTGFIVSPDMGETWDQFNLLQFGPTSPVRFQQKNAEGWMKVDLRKGWIGIDRVLFIKPKI